MQDRSDNPSRAPSEATGRYRRAAADYTGLSDNDPRVLRLAGRAASIADWAALDFLRTASARTRRRITPQRKKGRS